MDWRWYNNIYIIHGSMAFCSPILWNPLTVRDLHSRDHTLDGRLECIAQIWHIQPDMPFKAAWPSSGHLHCILFKSWIWKNPCVWFMSFFFLILFVENVHILLLRHWYFTSAIIIIVKIKEFLCSPVCVINLLHLKKKVSRWIIDNLWGSRSIVLAVMSLQLRLYIVPPPPGTGLYTMG